MLGPTSPVVRSERGRAMASQRVDKVRVKWLSIRLEQLKRYTVSVLYLTLISGVVLYPRSSFHEQACLVRAWCTRLLDAALMYPVQLGSSGKLWRNSLTVTRTNTGGPSILFLVFLGHKLKKQIEVDE